MLTIALNATRQIVPNCKGKSPSLWLTQTKVMQYCCTWKTGTISRRKMRQDKVRHDRLPISLQARSSNFDQTADLWFPPNEVLCAANALMMNLSRRLVRICTLAHSNLPNAPSMANFRLPAQDLVNTAHDRKVYQVYRCGMVTMTRKMT